MESFLENKNDLNGADLSVFIGIHTVLSAVLVSSTWYLFYVASPGGSSNAAASADQSLLWKRILSSPHVPTKLQTKAASFMDSTNNSKLMTFLQTKFPSIDVTRFTISYVEAKLVRLLFKPLTIPGRIWLSWKATVTWKHYFQKQQQPTTMAAFMTDNNTKWNLPSSRQSFLFSYKSKVINNNNYNNEPATTTTTTKRKDHPNNAAAVLLCSRSSIAFHAHPSSRLAS